MGFSNIWFDHTNCELNWANNKAAATKTIRHKKDGVRTKMETTGQQVEDLQLLNKDKMAHHLKLPDKLGTLKVV